MIVFSLTADILVFIAAVKCHVDMVTTAGIISYQANATYLDPIVYISPQMVFKYSLDKDVGGIFIPGNDFCNYILHV